MTMDESTWRKIVGEGEDKEVIIEDSRYRIVAEGSGAKDVDVSIQSKYEFPVFIGADVELSVTSDKVQSVKWNMGAGERNSIAESTVEFLGLPGGWEDVDGVYLPHLKVSEDYRGMGLGALFFDVGAALSIHLNIPMSGEIGGTHDTANFFHSMGVSRDNIFTMTESVLFEVEPEDLVRSERRTVL